MDAIEVRQSVITFSGDQAAARLPRGEYQAVLTEADHVLGANGSKVTWLYVRIVEAPTGAEEWIDRKVNVRLRPATS